MCRRGRLTVECHNFLNGFFFKPPNREPSRTTLAPVFFFVTAKYQFMLIRINTNHMMLLLSCWRVLVFQCSLVSNLVRAVFNISLANHNKSKQHNQPIRTRRKYMQPASSAGKRFSLVERKMAPTFPSNHRA